MFPVCCTYSSRLGPLWKRVETVDSVGQVPGVQAARPPPREVVRQPLQVDAQGPLVDNGG
jgi:hypothetical protein